MPGSIELRGELIELFPERIGDLEIIALVADHVDEGLVAGVAEIVFRRPHADGFAALAVQIGPIAPQRRGGHHAKRIGLRDKAAIGRHAQIEIAGAIRDKVFDHARADRPS